MEMGDTVKEKESLAGLNNKIKRKSNIENG